MPTPIQRQAFGLKILNAGHPSIRKLKSQGFQAEIHGNKFWNSSFLVMDYLKRNPLPPVSYTHLTLPTTPYL